MRGTAAWTGSLSRVSRWNSCSSDTYNSQMERWTGRIRGRRCCSVRSLGPATSAFQWDRAWIDWRAGIDSIWLVSRLRSIYSADGPSPRCFAALPTHSLAQCCPSGKLRRAGRGTSVAGARQATHVVGQEKIDVDGKFSNIPNASTADLYNSWLDSERCYSSSICCQFAEGMTYSTVSFIQVFQSHVKSHHSFQKLNLKHGSIPHQWMWAHCSRSQTGIWDYIH